MLDALTAPPIGALPPFVLPDRQGVPVNTAHLRGRRNLVLLLLPRLDADATAYLAAFAARRNEWAWLHTAVFVVAPDTAEIDAVRLSGISVLQDGGAVRAALLPRADTNVAVLIVANTEGRVTEWHTAMCVEGLPKVDTALAWAWEVARPRGACDGGVAWARPAAPVASLPTPIGHFTIGAQRGNGPRYRGAQRTRHARYARASD